MRVLIISPHFPPTNAADHQRVRLVLPYLREHGCEVEVLAVAAESVAAPRDPWLVAGLPVQVPVHRVAGLGLGWSRIPGLGTLTFRALRALRRRGDALLAHRHFDLVYFSTTQFGVQVLGPHWRKKFGVPFILDYQDPWVNDYYRQHPEITPPGGRWKYALADGLNRRQEQSVLRHCAGVTSVSAAYPRQIGERYAWLNLVAEGEVPRSGRGLAVCPFMVLPFPGDANDLLRVAADGTQQNIFTPGDGLRHWLYVGRGGADMRPALRGLFGALQAYLEKQPALRPALRLHFVGTSYAAAGKGQKTIEPLARDYGLADLVSEHPDRVPYSQTLRCLLDADALIVPGSDDPGYTASKIYPYLLAAKPLLAVFHENSSVVSLLRQVQGGVCVTFRTGEAEADIAARIIRDWLAPAKFSQRVPLNQVAFEPHLARAQAGRLAAFFNDCVAQKLAN